LNAVEINTSFHRSHKAKTYERWAGSTRDDFRFSVKVPKTITHEHQLEGCRDLVDRFAAEIAGLGNKLGVVLVQLPPTSIMRKRVADGFFRTLRKRVNASLAIEPRHASWFMPEVDDWLADRQISRVAADPARFVGAGTPAGWTGLVYYRWHGTPRVYYSGYDDGELTTLRQRLSKVGKRGIQRWCIFDNTAAGAAFGNALTLTRHDPLIS
jgi:uncharacterized protein YecE (DUF72 family)